MVEAYYCQIVFDGQLGLVLFLSSGQSNNQSKNCMPNYWWYFEVYFVPGGFPSIGIGNMWGARQIGKTLVEYDKTIPKYVSLAAYLTHGVFKGKVPMYWHLWAGFSATELTADGQYHAVDLYVQGPDMLPTPVIAVSYTHLTLTTKRIV